MRVAIDSSPLSTAHKVRGTGFYTKYLIESLKKYHPENEYLLFEGKKIPEKSDIVHFPYFDPFFLELPFRKKLKTVITIHDLTPLVFPNLFPAGLRGGIKFKIQRFLAKRADGIITDSESSKKDIEKILKIKSSKIYPIHLAAGEEFKKLDLTKKEKDEILKKYGLPEKFLLYVGDATANKNLKKLIEAVEILNLDIAVIGKVFEKNVPPHPWNKDLIYVQQEARSNNKIHILGFVSDEDLVKLYNLATVFVFPSLYEGFGLPVLEAAACGLPIITSYSGSIPEVIGEAAKFVDPYNPDAIAEGIKKVFEDEKLQEKLSNEDIKQAKKFSWEKTADLTVGVYEKIFNKA